MSHVRFILRFAGALVLAAGIGCQGLRPGSSPTVQAVDAETRKPIPGAEIRIWHISHPTSPNADTIAKTDSGGLAQLRGLGSNPDDVMLEVAAVGYVTEEKGVDRDGRVVVELYADPAPVVEMTLPLLFRGTVRVKVQVRDDAPATPGQRVFPVDVPESGEVIVTGPRLFRHSPPDFRAKFSGTAPLPEKPEDGQVGLWWLKADKDFEVYLVGNKSDYEAYWRDHPNEQPKEKKGGGKGHGGGGKGKGGGGGGRGGSGGGGRGGSGGSGGGDPATAGPVP
jgi:uncharacterized membrane protein YgcG